MLSLRTKQNSLSFRVGLGFTTIAIVLITALVMTIVQVAAIGNQITQVSTTELPSIKMVTNLLDSIEELQYEQKTWLLTNQNSAFPLAPLPLFKDDFFQTISNMNIISSNNIINSPELQQIQNDLATLKEKQDIFANLSSISSKETPLLFIQSIRPLIKSIHDNAVTYRDARQSELLGSLQQINTRLTTVFSVAISFLFIGLILCGLMALLLIRSITQPIYKLLNSTKKLATGSLGEDFTIIGSLEFEELSQSLNNVVTTLRSVANVTEKMAMGDYSQRVVVKSPNDQLAISVNQMLGNFNQIVNQANLIANGDYNSEIIPRSEVDKLGTSLQNMTQMLRQNKLFSDNQNWLKDGLASFAQLIGETQNLETLGQRAINEICRHTNAGCGALYIYNEKNAILELLGTYALTEQRQMQKTIKLGIGIIGQAGLDKQPILLKKSTDIFITSATIEEAAETLYCIPIFYEKSLMGVLEIAWNHDLNDLIKQYLDSLAPMLASHMQAAYQQKITEKLLNEQKLLTEKLQAQQIELQETAAEFSLASKYKSEFLANMSHELRTPLNSLIILAKLFEENREHTLNKDQVESAKIMVKSGHDLLTLINDILDLAKVEAGKIEIQFGRVRIADFLESTMRNFNHVTEDKHLQLLTEIAPSLPVFIVTDEQRVSQVLRNLLSNAIKFTETGYVKLLIERPKESEIRLLPPEQRYLAFRVSDTGVGIPKNKQELVFQAFQQADGTTSRKYGGTGLGLSISTQFAQLLKGTISLESTESVGSTFTLIIPENTALLENEEEETTTANSEANQTAKEVVSQPSTMNIAPITKPNLPVEESHTHSQSDFKYHNEQVLLVDDDMRNVYALSHVLKTFGLNILAAGNGQLALDILSKNPDIKLILMDIMMPVMDGYQAIAKIRENPALQHIPIIATTAKAMQGDKEKCIEIGATDFLPKPIDIDSLLNLIKKWIPADVK
ncbi:MAG: response regulator [Legionellales bacterium]|nr:response regulator [Legionellales bacterium]